MTIVNCEGIELDTVLVKREDMPNEIFQEIYDLCGVETAVNLLNYMPANTIIVPARGMRKIVSKIIRELYDGSTASLRRIARRFKMPELKVRKILTESRVNVPVEGQCQFEFLNSNNNPQ